MDLWMNAVHLTERRVGCSRNTGGRQSTSRGSEGLFAQAQARPTHAGGRALSVAAGGNDSGEILMLQLTIAHFAG